MNESIQERLGRIIGIHFDPQTGSAYWLDKQRSLGLDVRQDIRTIEDLPRLGAMDEQALANRPIEDFIPRRFRDCRDYLLAETAGTLGRPKTAVHRRDEFHQAFIEPFIKAAKRSGFPVGGHWLFIGPTGPHIIGQAAAACAQALGGGDIFRVDFDPRWAKALVAGSFAAQRYLRHIQQQAMTILEVQHIEVIFATPAVLDSLSGQLPLVQRQSIRGIHLGGMAAGSEFMQNISAAFPKAVILSGFGNTLFGMMPQLRYDPAEGFDYYPYGNRLVVRIIRESDDSSQVDLAQIADYGQRGRIVMHRLDEFQLILNMVERDTAIRIAPKENAREDGFILDGIRDPHPVVNEIVKPSLGLY